MSNNKQNELIEFINTRRSIRFFTDEKVSSDDLEKILEAGLRAPSSKNSQPWYIVVLQGEEKNEVCKWVSETEGKAPWELPEMLGGQKTNSPYDSVKASLNFIQESSALLLLFNRGPFTGGRDGMDKNPERSVFIGNELVGVGACMENILLATHALGLGGVALMDIWPAAKKVKDKYDIKFDFIVGVAIGYPKMSPPKRPIETEKFSRFV